MNLACKRMDQLAYLSTIVLTIASFLDSYSLNAQEWIPTVSIITSVYKGNYFIAPFLADIVRQTVFNQCELILINAASPHDEKDIIQRYMKEYPNIVYWELDEDPGLYEVWNYALIASRGKYLTNANIDDRLSPLCYERHMQFLEQHPEVDLVYSNSYWTRLPNETFEMNSAPKASSNPEFSLKNLAYGCLPAHNPMWRKSMHSRYGLFNNTFTIIGDYEMWIRAAIGGAQFKKIDEILGLYLYNPVGLSTSYAYYEQRKKEEKVLAQQYASFFMDRDLMND